MGFFSKKDKLAIPLPPNEQPSRSHSPAGGHQTPDQANANRNELFGSSSPAAGGARPNPYGASRSGGSDLYSARAAPDRPTVDLARLKQEQDPMRGALFAGYNPDALPKSEGRKQYDSSPYAGGGGGEEGGLGGTEQDQEEEVEMIKRDIRGVKQETLGSSRNALRIAREAEETARTTLGKLGDQSGAFLLLFSLLWIFARLNRSWGSLFARSSTQADPSSSSSVLQNGSQTPSGTSTCPRRPVRERTIRRTSSSTSTGACSSLVSSGTRCGRPLCQPSILLTPRCTNLDLLPFAWLCRSKSE